MIKIDARELEQILTYTPTEQNIMLVGAHGIGKSRILSDYYREQRKIPLITFFLGQMSDPGDLIGLMQKNEKTGHSEFLPPYWWPDRAEPVALFLDELNRARPEILQSVMDLTLNRTLAGKSLPKGSVIVSAVNYGDQYQLTDLDPALVSRFNIYQFEPTLDDWLAWAQRVKIDRRVIEFIRKYPQFLDGHTEQTAQRGTFDVGIEKTPDRRAWERVAKLIKDIDVISELHVKLIAGIVGVHAAIHFKKSLGEVAKLNIEALLYNYDPSLFKGLKLQDYIQANEQLFSHLASVKLDNARKQMALENLLNYIRHLKKAKLQEAIAHFASLLENPNYEKVLGMLFIDSDELMAEIATYIEGIDLK